MRMWTSQDLVFPQPFLRDRPQVAQDLHGLRRVEDVIDHAFEVERVVRVWHNGSVEHGRQLKRATGP